MYVYCVYLLCIYKYTYSIYFENIYMYIHLYSYITYKYIENVNIIYIS